MFTATLHIILILFVLSEAAKVWMESKTWNENFKSQLKNVKMSNVIEGNFDLTELIALTRAEVNEPHHMVDETIKTAFSILAKKVCELGYTEIHGFGSFRVDTIAARSGTDPQGNHYDAPERLTIEFNPAKQFRDELAELSGKKVIA